MTIKVTSSYTMQNALATAYKNTATAGMLFSSTTPVTTGAATGEVASSTYARLALTWGAVSNGAASLSPNAVFNLAAGDNVGAFGVCTSTTKTTADVLDWYAFASVQAFSSNGTFTISATATVS